MKRPASINKEVAILWKAFGAQKVFGTFEKQAPELWFRWVLSQSWSKPICIALFQEWHRYSTDPSTVAHFAKIHNFALPFLGHQVHYVLQNFVTNIMFVLYS